MTRKQVRQELGELFTDTGAFTSVYTYAPATFNRANKVLVIHSDETYHDFISAGVSNAFYRFILDVFVLRSGTTFEDDLDDLAETIRATLRANVSNEIWDHLEMLEQSEAEYAEVSGTPYRVEHHYVKIKEQGS